MLVNNCLVERLQTDKKGMIYSKKVKIVLPTDKILIRLRGAYGRPSLTSTNATENEWFAFEYERKYNQIGTVWYRMRGFGIETVTVLFCNCGDVGIIEIPKLKEEALIHPHPYIRYRAMLNDDPTKIR